MDWQSYLEISNDNIEDLRTVGYLYIKQGCYDIALDFFQALVILNPESAYDLQTLGALYLQKEQYTEALSYFDKVLAIEPDNLLVQLNKAKTLFSLGYRTQGIILAKKLSVNPDKTFANQALALINAYS